MKTFQRIVLHPFLLSLYPVLALHAANLGQVEPNVSLRALAVSFVLVGIFMILGIWLSRDQYTTGLLVSGSLLLIFSYGHAYGLVEGDQIGGILVGRHRFLLPMSIVLWVTFVLLTLRLKNRARSLNGPLNFILLVLVVIPLIQIGQFHLSSRRFQFSDEQESAFQNSDAAGEDASQVPPDIYYIILDAYAREDVMAQYYNFDNRPFLEGLEQQGFYVASCSQSNYAQTELSLASSLNYAYLPELGSEFVQENTDRSELWPLIRQSRIREFLEKRGYKTFAFETGFYWSQLMNADVYLTPNTEQLDLLRLRSGLSSFEALLLRSTIFLVLFDGLEILPNINQPVFQQLDRTHYDRVLFTLGELARPSSDVDRPKFVFAHIVSPHTPFVFGSDGNFVSYDDDMYESDSKTEIRAYREQVQFLNGRILEISERILEDAERPPVIIIQADHGPGSQGPEDKMKILNAYFLPESGRNKLYPSVSPVNTFRVVLNSTFGLNLPLYEDISYYSAYPYAYDFFEVDSRC